MSELINSVARRLQSLKVVNTDDYTWSDWQAEAKIILSYALQVSYSDLRLNDYLLTPTQQAQVNEWLAKRALGMSIYRAIGKKPFFEDEFLINYNDNRVFEPRSDTETLVRTVLNCNYTPNPSILDLGTGSGCILLSLVKKIPFSTGLGVDISLDSVKIATINSQQLGLQSRTKFIQLDYNLPHEMIKNFDIIVANPPYIDLKSFSNLPTIVKDFDPHLALFGGNDGLYFYRLIVQHSITHHWLSNKGILAFEIGFDQAESVSNLMRDYGFNPIVVKDYQSQNRVVYSYKQG